ncbi:MAG: hypothetical protein JWP57_4336 [Spirosoma sp.]|nr:hypothetical protein [Spirosoma sp.]
MSFLEWFLESDNPGPVGKLEVDVPEPDDEQPPKKWMIWLAIILGIVLGEVSLMWVFNDWPFLNISQILFRLGGLSLYVLTSYRLSARPDYSNLGLLGGVVDNPFRSSDNFNRWLVYLHVLLVPGKFMAYSLVMGWFLFQSIYKRPNR